MKCKGDFGGGMTFINSSLKILNSEFSNNKAGFYGGAFFMHQNSVIQLYNVRILNNYAGESGGGIFAYGELIIDGESSIISRNDAKNWAGGILIKNKAIINNCIISKNKALNYSGWGIRVDEELILNKAKIYDNWCNQYGGVIYYQNAKFIYDENEIKNMVYNNKAEKNGNDIFPLKE